MLYALPAGIYISSYYTAGAHVRSRSAPAPEPSIRRGFAGATAIAHDPLKIGSATTRPLYYLSLGL